MGTASAKAWGRSMPGMFQKDQKPVRLKQGTGASEEDRNNASKTTARNNREPFSGDPQATATGLSLPHQPPVPTPSIPCNLSLQPCLPRSSAQPFPLSIPSPLLAASSRFLHPLSHCRPKRLLLIFQQAVDIPNAASPHGPSAP